MCPVYLVIPHLVFAPNHLCGLIMQMHCARMQSCHLKFREPMAFHTHGAVAALETTSDQSFTVTPPIADRKKRFAESMSPAALDGDTTW